MTEYTKEIDVMVMSILATPYPKSVDDYAIKMYYLYNGHNPRFIVHEKKVISEEVAELQVDSKHVKINIRTGKFDFI